jgi:phage-related protein (TIGR01555 family)
VSKSVWERLDGWVNSVTGLGGVRDKVQGYLYQQSGRIDDEQLEAMYDADDMAARICESVPEHMLRRGFEVATPELPELGASLVEYLNRLHFVASLTDALVFERVFGGSALVMGFDDGRSPEEPLDEANIRGLRFINALDKRDCYPVYWYRNPNEPKYGKPSIYRVLYLAQGVQAPGTPESEQNYQQTVYVHESRMLVFAGGRATRRNRLRYNGWGTSVLARCYGPLRGFNGNWQSVENMMQDASQGVFAIKGLHEVISSGNRSALEQRMTLLDMGRSVARAILVDADGETFTRQDTTMSGLPELIDRTATRLASAARMPVTVLHGISPAGLNATGASDVRSWYDTLEAERTQKLQQPLTGLVRLVCLCQDGPAHGIVPEKYTVEFPSLWQETEQERATIAATQTQSDVALIQAGVITAEEVAVRRAGELGIDPEPRQKAVESDMLALAIPTPTTETTPLESATVAQPTAEETAALPSVELAKSSLNGAQVASLLSIVNSVAAKEIPRETGVRLILAAFPLSEAEAEALMGPVGRTFFVETPDDAQPS